MGRKYFGTDGVRGTVGEAPITPDFVMRLGYAAGTTLAAREHLPAGEHPAVLIGKDTRISGYMLEAALEAGFAAAGVDVMLTGPLPTPAIAYLTRALRLQAGVVISASHNPFADNGIKIFARDGYKLPDEVELEIEKMLESPELDRQRAAPGDVGYSRKIEDSRGRYVVYLKAVFPARQKLDGFRIDGIRQVGVLEKAGLQNEDVLAGVNGAEIRDPGRLWEIFKQLQHERTVRLNVVRQSQPMTLVVEIRG